ncbi:MAG: tetratricopeptide repeat protein [Bacillota bacterium]
MDGNISTGQTNVVPNPPARSPKTFSMITSIIMLLVTVTLVVGIGMKVGNSYFWLNKDMARLQQQVTYYRQMVEDHPEDPQQRVNLAFAFYELKDYRKAVLVCEDALKIDPNFYPAYLNKGYALIMLKEYDLALEAFQKTVEINPNDFKAHLNLGITFSEINMFDQALEEISIAQELNPGAVEIHYNAGQVYEKMKDYKSAAEAYQNALNLDPGYDKARAALERLK